MGADCCGGKKNLPPPGAARDSCDDGSVSDCDKSVACCTPGNEKCNEECLKTVAATLCAEGVGDHADGHNDCCARHDSNELDVSACDAHLQMAFAQYQSFLDNVRCICRSMIERGYKSCCKTSDAGAGAQGAATVPSGSSGCGAGGKGCCTPSATSIAVRKEDCCSTGGTNGQSQCQGGNTDKSQSTGCCNNEQASMSGPTSKDQPAGCCGSKKLPDNNCCSNKTDSGNDCAKPEPDDCCNPKQKPADGCNSTGGTGGCCSSTKLIDDNCCASKTGLENSRAKPGLDNCCKPKQNPVGGTSGSSDGEQVSCCSSDRGLAPGCRDACCDGKAKSTPDPCCNTKQCQPANLTVYNGNTARDAETRSGEEVRISVTGMTCNGCSDNLARNLAANGVYNIRINYLQGYADFTIDPAENLHLILAKTQEATGFLITILNSKESITVLTSGPQMSRALNHVDLDGVGEVVIVNKTTVRIHYNPTIIGARDLFHKIGDMSLGLAPPQNDQQLSSGRKKFATLLVQTIVSFSLTIPILVLTWGNTHVDEHTEAIVTLILGTLVQLLAVPVFYKPALRSLIKHGTLELDMLVVVAITAAFIYSIVAFGYLMSGAPLETGAFFETSSLLISLIMLGRLVASYARIRAVSAVSVRSLQASTAILVENGMDCEIDAQLLQFGDTFKVTPHSRIPTDGTVITGVSEVDESMVTGESLPVIKQPGASLIAGTTNGAGTLIVRLTRLPGKNTITDIARLVEDASNSKPRVQETADRVSGWFLPTVLTIAAVIFIIWTVVGVTIRNQTSGQAVATAITYSVAVLAVSCPCGIGLAVPLVLVVANGIAARGGVIVKSAQCTERSRNTTDVVFDKTGTLTEPDLEVAAEEFFNEDVTNARAVTRALIRDSQHPVSVAIAKHLGSDAEPSPAVTNIQSIPGAGIEGSMSGAVVRAGHASWTESEELPEVRRMLDDGMSILVVARDSVPIACYGLRVRLRTDAIATVAKLREAGIDVHLVSGDHNKAVQAVAAAVGIDRANVSSQQKPQDKQNYVATLMAQPGKVVMFCGDGTNDAVAVAQADIGIQLSDTISSEVTRSAADIVLLSGLSGIPFLIEVSHAAFARIAFNFIWSAIYNVFSILLAAGAFVRVRIPPAYAGAGELVSILPIIIASLTMLLLKLRPA